MALINKKDKSYIRIDSDNSYISGTGVHIGIFIYNSYNDRELEKTYLAEIADFLQKFQEYETDLQIKYDAQLLSEKEINDFYAISSLYADMQQYYYKSMSYLYNDRFLAYSNIATKINSKLMFPDMQHVPNHIIELLKTYGYNQKWAEHPVKISYQILYCLKDIPEQPWSMELFYDILKNHYYSSTNQWDYIDGKSSEGLFEDA